MINISISESNRYFEHGLKKILESYFFYQNVKINFTSYDKSFADESWLIFRPLDERIDNYGCHPFISNGQQRVVPICMPEDLTKMAMRPCIRNTVFLFRSDSVDTLLQKLDELWNPWEINNRAGLYDECTSCEGCSFQQLSYNEKRIIRYIGMGFSISNISRILKKNVKTVSSQKRSAMKKLNMSRNIDLYRFLIHSAQL
ncbi:LuxR C-terminal-related transcriptional regulator [Serratia sp. UGAL515B_01]|uniref:LuxR C-terminal-related transcriptional regulator n=1 Tax=Serratia sp. UGAL515B_01 TaxID=2986763 RepID=UPI002952B1B3|nr:LuxR C-terminal-related transcriptional regulator [Serratia sp. UGAL515B_01]WON78399.1 LuxR C-terminal-related transcriptional regulator [Serratia sp. UGAL515B_01]